MDAKTSLISKAGNKALTNSSKVKAKTGYLTPEESLIRFSLVYAPIQVWDALRLRSTERFRLGAGRRARVPPCLSTSVEKVPSIAFGG